MLVSGDSRKAEYPEKNLSEQPEKIKRKRIMSYGVTFSSKLERNHTAGAYQRLVQSLCYSFSFSLNCVKKLVSLCSCFFFFAFVFCFMFCFLFFVRLFFFLAKARKRRAVRVLDF